MKLIEVKCPNCKASINIMDNEKKVRCEYCGTNFIIDDGVITVRHLKAGQITDEQEFINADTNLNKFKNYSVSYEQYKKLSNRYVNDKRIWIGLLRSYTKEFTFKFDSDDFRINYETYWNHYVSLATKSEITKYEKKYNDYVKLRPIKIMPGNPKKEKNYVLVTIFGGTFGLHKFLQGDIKMGFVYLFTFGIFGFGYIKDVYNECAKWRGSNQLIVSKIIIAIIMVLLGLDTIKYSFLLFIPYLITSVLCFRFFWKMIGRENNLLLRIISIIVLFFFSIIISPSGVPSSLKGRWTIIDSKNSIIEINLYENSVIELNGKDTIKKYSIDYYKNILYFYDDEANLKYKVYYNKTINKLCLLKNNKCSAYYKINKK